ncbi:MAG: hypothetical protein WC979_08835 [Candidatus Pacearchaeota archaeon]|jgi:hypothetical protein
MPSKKYKPTKEVIEESPSPEYEHRLMKYPGIAAGDITDYKLLERDASPEADLVKKKQYLDKGNKRKYALIHTHASKFKASPWEKFFDFFTFGYFLNDLRQIKHSSAIHGGTDIRAFLFNPSWKSAPIAVRDPKTGKILGYNILKKTKKTPTPPIDPDFVTSQELQEGLSNWKYSQEILNDADKYDDIRMDALSSHNPAGIRNVYDQMLKKYHLQSRFVPGKDYQVNKTGTAFERKALESKVEGAATVILLATSLFFISSSLTGNATMSLNETTSSLIGGTLFILGIIGAFFYLRNKR